MPRKLPRPSSPRLLTLPRKIFTRRRRAAESRKLGYASTVFVQSYQLHPSIELLEDRRLLAVDVADIKAGLMNVDEAVNTAFEVVDVLQDIPLLENLDVVLEQQNTVQTALNQVITVVNAIPTNPGETVAQFLSRFDDPSGALYIPPASIDVGATAVDFTAIFNPAAVTFNLDVPDSLELGGFELDLPNLPDIPISNEFDLTAVLRIDDSGSLSIRPAGTSLVYTVGVNDYSAQVSGQVAGAVDITGYLGFDGNGFSFSPSLTVTFGNSNTFTSPANLASTANLSASTGTVTVPLAIGVEMDPLPEFQYRSILQYNPVNGALTQSPGQLVVNGTIVATENGGIVDLSPIIVGVLKDVGAEMFGDYEGLIPVQVSDALLGNTEIVPGVTFKELLQGKSPLDLVQIVADNIAPGSGTALEILETVISVDNLVTQLNAVTPGNALQTYDDIRNNSSGVRFEVLENPFQTLLTILQGEVAPLITWPIDAVKMAVDSFAESHGVPGPVARTLLIEGGLLQPVDPNDDPNDPTTPLKIVASSNFDVTKVLLDAIKPVLEDVHGDLGKVVDELKKVYDQVKPDEQIFNFQFEFFANATVGVNSQFLLDPSLSGILDSLYIQAEGMNGAGTTGQLLFASLSGGFDVDLPSDLLSAGGFFLGWPSVSVGEGGVSIDFDGDGEDDAAIGGTGGKVLSDLLSGDAEGAISTLGEAVWNGVTNPVGTLQALVDGVLKLNLFLEASGQVGVAIPAGPDAASPNQLTLKEWLGIDPQCVLQITPASLFLEVGGKLDVVGQGVLGPESFVVNLVADDNCDDLAALGVIPEVVAEIDPTNPERIIAYGTDQKDIITVTPIQDGIRVTRNGKQTDLQGTFTQVLVDLTGLTPFDSNITSADGGDDHVTIAADLDPTLEVTIRGGSGGDTLTARQSAGQFFGGTVWFDGGLGDDTLIGGSGSSTLLGGLGDDTLEAGAGPSLLDGGAGDDLLTGLKATSGMTNVTTSSGLMIGGTGLDIISVGEISRGNWTLIGGATFVTPPLTDEAGSGIISGGYGDDRLIAGNALYINGLVIPIEGSGEASWLTGGPGNDQLIGSPGDDFLAGGWYGSSIDSGSDIIDGGAGDDHLIAGNFEQLVLGGPLEPTDTPAGPARLIGGPGNDFLQGGSGDDVIEGGSGIDIAEGKGGSDLFFGGDDADVFIWNPGDGSDLFEGGSGDDRLIFNGSNGDEIFNIFASLANPNRAILTRNLGNVTIDMADVEQIDLNAEGGADSLTVGRAADGTLGTLHTTHVKAINLDLGTADDAADEVFVDGLNRADDLFISHTSHVHVAGLPYDINIINAAAVDDRLTVRGNAGNDFIKAAAGVETIIAITLDGGDGDDYLSADAILLGGAGDDTLEGLPGSNDFFDGGNGFDTMLIVGTPGDDVIAVSQTSATAVSVTVGGVTDNETIANMEAIRIEAGDGDDVIGVSVADNLVGSLAFRINGGNPNASDRLVVRDEGLGDLVVHREGIDGRSGSINIGALAPIHYDHVEFVNIAPLNTVTGGTGVDGLGQLLVIKPDLLESNPTRLTATPLGGEPLFLKQLSIDPGPTVMPPPFGNVAGDEDWFEFRPGQTGTYRFDLLFEEIAVLANGRPGLPNNGNLDIQVYSDAGVLIATAATLGDDETLDVSMNGGQSYFLRVFGVGDAFNVYDLNVSQVDLRGPQVTGVTITGSPNFNLFNPKPTAGPTPLVHSLTITLEDLPPRSPGDPYPALDMAVAEHVGNYLLVGDATGAVTITNVTVTLSTPTVGVTPTATIRLDFAEPLPDDRFTLTILDNLIDPSGNALDGESGAAAPFDNPATIFPSGDGQPGGDFVARFTVDSRPEIAVYAGTSIYVDTNGNFVWDSENLDDTNEDITYVLGINSDQVFAGNFARFAGDTADGFSKIAAYGRVNGQWRWLIDTNNNGIPDINIVEQSGLAGIPIAGNFDNNPNNGDEVGIYTGSAWWFDTNHDFQLDTMIPAFVQGGHPIVADFNGDGHVDLGVWRDDTFYFNLTTGTDKSWDTTVDHSFRFGFQGTREIPVAADMNGDGFADVGLWAPDQAGVTPGEISEWYFLVSENNQPIFNRIVFDATLGRYTIPFHPEPFGNDFTAQFGDSAAIPLVGNFDPPVTSQAATTLRDAMHQNVANRFDIDSDGQVTGFDLLAIVNDLRGSGQRTLAAQWTTGIPSNYVDVDGDGRTSGFDLLELVNHLRQQPRLTAAPSAQPVALSAPAEKNAPAAPLSFTLSESIDQDTASVGTETSERVAPFWFVTSNSESPESASPTLVTDEGRATATTDEVFFLAPQEELSGAELDAILTDIADDISAVWHEEEEEDQPLAVTLD